MVGMSPQCTLVMAGEPTPSICGHTETRVEEESHFLRREKEPSRLKSFVKYVSWSCHQTLSILIKACPLHPS
jgi:hypothetical protein